MRPRTRLLLTGLTQLGATANALRPPKAVPAAVPAFAWGLPVSELPIQTGLLHVATAAALSRSGGGRGWRGKLGLAGTAASLVGLVHLHRVAARSGEVLEAALVDELGADYRSRISEPFSPAPVAPLTRRTMLAPDFNVRRRYRVARDLSYGDNGKRNLLDVWRRADLAADAKAPVLFQVHGGGWTMGKKEGQGEPLMAHLAERGWVCVATNYRLSPKASWPEHVVDVKAALAWVKANIAEHGGDPDFVVITGGSAGGHLTALTALTPNLADFQPGFEDADTSVAAAVPFYGIYDFTNRHGNGPDIEQFLSKRVFKTSLRDDRARWEQASPLTHVNADAPPFFVLHGTNDSLVPVEQARTFVDELRKESNQPVAYAELPLAQHAFEALPSVRAHHTVHAVERFLAVVRSEHGGRTPAEAVST